MKTRPPRIAIASGLVGGAALGLADLLFALAGPEPGEAGTLAVLALCSVALLAGAGAIAGAVVAFCGLALGREQRDTCVRALAGRPRSAFAQAVIPVLAGALLALGGGAAAAMAALAGGAPTLAALGVGGALGLGALAVLGLRRLLRGRRLPSAPWIVGAVLGAIGTALAVLLREGGALETIGARVPWSVFAGVMASAGAALVLARRTRREGRGWWKVAGAVALAGAMGAAVWLGRDPEVRAASEGTAIAGRVLDRALAMIGAEEKSGSALLVAAAAGTGATTITSTVAPTSTLPLPSKSTSTSTSTSKSTPTAKKAVPKKVAKRPYHLVLITVDALRADHLSVYGYGRATSPALEAFARKAAVFQRAYAQETKTKGSIPSLLTSRYPSDIHWGGPRYLPLGDAEVTVAERLVGAGYHTAAFVTHSYFLANYRLNRGFAHYDTALVSTDPDVAFGRASGHLLADRVIDHLGRVPRGRPFFLWAHFFDPHHRYIHHPGFSSFGSRAVDRYDGEVAFTDHHIGRVLAAVARHPEAERIAVVVTADHGEAFGEHGAAFHGTTLHEEEIRVPLLLSVPGGSKRRVATPVALVDVAPTLLDLAGLPPDERHRGRSLVGAALGEALPVAPVYAEILPENQLRAQIAIVRDEWKLIYDEPRGILKLFHLRDDPGERVNRRRSDPLVLQELASALLRWRGRPVPTTATRLTAERLRAFR